MWASDERAVARRMAADAVAGGRCVTWTLPPDESCAGRARRHVREVMFELGLPAGTVDDACTAVSEIATNVYVHAYGRQAPITTGPVGLPEIYLYLRNGRSELVTKIFDTSPWRGPLLKDPCFSDLEAESGRGLGIVDALAQEHRGAWGVHRTTARLGGVAVPGKAVYFTLPFASGVPGPFVPQEPIDCREAARALEAELLARGVDTIHRCEGWNMAVLSIRPEITLWARAGGLLLTTPRTGTVRYPLEDVAELVEVIVQCNEDLNAR
ncbi:ATP-binding protein [Spirillospora sp. NPDC052269]